MAEREHAVNLNDYLAAVRANNPKLADYWPGAKPGQSVNPAPKPAPAPTITAKEEPKGSSIKAGCLPCSINHMSVCSGLLQEGIRFAQADGVNSDTPIDRINTCLDELNALERKDLTPELIDTLPPWEKELALKALNASRNIRHSLEGIKTLDDLIHASAQTTTVRKEIGREWFKRKLATMSPQDKQHLVEEALEKIKKEDDHA